MLRVERKTVLKACSDGQLAGASKVGGSWHIPAEALGFVLPPVSVVKHTYTDAYGNDDPHQLALDLPASMLRRVPLMRDGSPRVDTYGTELGRQKRSTMPRSA